MEPSRIRVVASCMAVNAVLAISLMGCQRTHPPRDSEARDDSGASDVLYPRCEDGQWTNFIGTWRLTADSLSRIRTAMREVEMEQEAETGLVAENITAITCLMILTDMEMPKGVLLMSSDSGLYRIGAREEWPFSRATPSQLDAMPIAWRLVQELEERPQGFGMEEADRVQSWVRIAWRYAPDVWACSHLSVSERNSQLVLRRYMKYGKGGDYFPIEWVKSSTPRSVE